MLKLLLCTGFLPVVAWTAQFDPPDLNLEAEFHHQFVAGAASPAHPSALAKDAYVESYDIQSGETLWSLSQILYGDGNYWPRVWAANHSITNPHLIRPGHKLQLLLGSEDDTPAFRFSEEGESEGVELASSYSNNPVIEIPPPEIPPRPVLKVPPSFPEWQSVFRRQVKPIEDDRALNRKRDRIADRIYLRAWVDEQPLEPIGFFMENDTESGLPVVNQFVFIKVKKGLAHADQKLLIAHSAGKIKQVQDEFENDRPAYLIQTAGELKITEAMPSNFLRSRDREEFECFRAIMTKTTGLSLKDNALIPGEIQFVNLSAEGPHGTTQAEVLGSERNVTSMLYGQGDIVFLNKGSQEGLAVGQILDVYANRRSRYPGTPVTFSPAPSGRVKVVRVSAALTTALVLKAHDGILQGDQVREIVDRPAEVEKLPQMDLTPISGGILGTENGPQPSYDE